MAGRRKPPVDLTTDAPTATEVDITNEFALHSGVNLPNHSTTLAGRGKFVRVGLSGPLVFRTKQQAYRFAAHLVSKAEILPGEDSDVSFEEVLDAVHNS